MLALVLSIAWMLMIALGFKYSMGFNDVINFKYAWILMIALVLSI